LGLLDIFFFAVNEREWPQMSRKGRFILVGGG